MAELPVEVWSLICEPLRPTIDDSKPAERDSKLHLYHALDFEGHRIARLRRILRVLLKNLRLCNLVRSLRIQSWATKHDREASGTDPVATEMQIEVDVPWAAMKLALPEADAHELSLGVRTGLQDAELALLLYACRGIETIYFYTVYAFGSSLVHTAMRWASGHLSTRTDSFGPIINPRPLHHVRELDISFHDNLKSVAFEDIGTVLQLPYLETIKGEAISIHGERLPSRYFTSAVKHVMFGGCFDTQGIAWLLARCPGLETLQLFWDSMVDCDCIFNFDTMSAAILNDGPNLMVVQLSPQDVNTYNCQLGTLRNARKLRELAIPALALFCHGDHDEIDLTHRLSMILPPSLEVLEIEWSYDEIFLDDDELLVAILRSGRFANLKQILIDREAGFTGNLDGLQWEHLPFDGNRVEVRRKY